MDNSDFHATQNNQGLAAINGTLQWICFFLILITFNTCQMKDFLSPDAAAATKERRFPD